MRSKKPIGRQGDVVRVRELGKIKPHEGHDLVVIFLGACPIGEEPDVPDFLRKLGWARTHCFELTLYWVSGEDRWITRQCFTAESPGEAAASAIRAAVRARDDGDGALEGLSLCLMRLGPIGPDGRPENGRGKAFVRWSAETGTTLEDVLKSSAASAEPS